jgi:hypothetical protein
MTFYDSDHHKFRMYDSDIRSSVRTSPNDERTIANVRQELVLALRAIDALESAGREQNVGAQFDQTIAVFRRVRHLERWLPEVECWCVGHWQTWGHLSTERRTFSVASGHTTAREARRWLTYWPKWGKQMGHQEREWVVERHPCGYINMMRGGPPRMSEGKRGRR